MTVVLDLKLETLRRIEEQAAQKGTTPEQILTEMAESNFDDNDDTKFDAAMNRVFTKYHRAFEVLAEGAK